MAQHRARKRFGQHFLHDDHVIQNIFRAVSPKETEHLVEIGPGQGALTYGLVESVQRLDVIEIDRDLVEKLKKNFEQYNHFLIHNNDVLQFDFRSIYTERKPLRIIGNLPYNISTPLLFHLFSFLDIIQDMYFMLQKEVVERLTATPGSPSYGRLSVMAQYHCQAASLFDVSPNAFSPPPKVMSAVVRLKPFEKPPYLANNYRIFSEMVKSSFQHKRKTLQNNLKRYLTSGDLMSLHLDPRKRAEQLSIADFVAISNFLDKKAI